MLTIQSQVRAAFWRDLDIQAPNDRGGPDELRAAWREYVDMLARCGEISEELAAEVAL